MRAETSAESIQAIFNNIPDAVIVLSTKFTQPEPITIIVDAENSTDFIKSQRMINNTTIHYCNKQADKLFNTNLS